MRELGREAVAAGRRAHGAGVWKDPNHYVGEESLAGLRFIAEQPAHVLQVVGTDDGVTWWHITGTCSGPGMTNINLDFSPKGGPSGVTGKWTYDPQWVIAREKIHFPDGNVWESTGYVPGAIELDDAVDDHAATRPCQAGFLRGGEQLSDGCPHISQSQ